MTSSAPQHNKSPSESAQTLIRNVERARDALGESKKSLRGVYDLPSREGIAGQYRSLLVSEVMLDRAIFIENMRSLNTDTMLITEACRNLENPDDAGFIHKLAEAVIEFNKKAQTLMLRFSNALARIKALKDHIDEEINKRRPSADASRVPPSLIQANAAERRGLFTRTLLKFQWWLSNIARYTRRRRKREISQSADDMAVESGDLLVLALALKDLDVLLQSMNELVVSIGEYMRTAKDETEMLVGWFVTDPGKIKDIVEPIENLEVDLVLYEAIFDRFQETMPAECSEERLAELESSAIGLARVTELS